MGQTTKQTPIKELRKDYLQTKALAEMDLMDGDVATKYQREGAKNKALTDLPTTKNRLVSTIVMGSVTVAVTDDVTNLKEVEKLAAENDNVFLVDFKAIEKTLAGKLYPAMQQSYPFNTETVGRINNLLAGEIADSIGAEFIPPIKGNSLLYKVCTDRDSFLTQITRALRDTFGSDLNLIYVRKQISDAILQRITHDKVIALVVNVPLGLVSDVRAMTGRGAALTTMGAPDSIKLVDGMTADEIKTEIAKSLKKK